jgi:hypothetical protein
MRTFAKFLTVAAFAFAIFALNMAWTSWNNLSARLDKPETYYPAQELGWLKITQQPENVKDNIYLQIVHFEMKRVDDTTPKIQKALWGGWKNVKWKDGDEVLVYQIQGLQEPDSVVYIIKDYRQLD